MPLRAIPLPSTEALLAKTMRSIHTQEHHLDRKNEWRTAISSVDRPQAWVGTRAPHDPGVIVLPDLAARPSTAQTVLPDLAARCPTAQGCPCLESNFKATLVCMRLSQKQNKSNQTTRHSTK